MEETKFVKIVVGGWYAKKNYRTDKVVFYGYINKETSKAILLDTWIPKACIEKMETFNKAILDKVVEEAKTEEEAIKMLKEKGETFVYCPFRYSKVLKRWEGYAIIY